MNYPQYILEQVLDTIFPVKCIGCGVFLSKQRGYVCKNCYKAIPINKSFECVGCKRRVILGKTCPSCLKNNSIDQLLIVSDYENELTVKIIKTLKYRFIQEMADPISSALKKYLAWLSGEKKFNILAESPLIAPIPLGRRRLNWRGFNQAELIAEELCSILNYKATPLLMKRVADKKPQAEIEEREQRLENIKNIFQTSDLISVKGRVIVLIDDVCTTGATLNECARVLKNTGALKVIGLVFARG